MSARARKQLAFCISGLTVASMVLLGGAYDIVILQEIAIIVWWVLGLGSAISVLCPWRHEWSLWAP